MQSVSSASLRSRLGPSVAVLDEVHQVALLLGADFYQYHAFEFSLGYQTGSKSPNWAKA